MKRTFNFLTILVIFAFVLSSCGQHVPPGYVGVKVKTLGQNKGVQPTVLPVGRYWMGPYYTLYTYPTFMNIYPFTLSPTEGSPVDEAIRFQSVEGITCNVDLAVSCHVDATKAAVVFTTYRKNMDEIIKLYIRQDISNYFVDYASKLRVDELYSTKKIDMINYALAQLKSKYDTSGIAIEALAYKSNIRFPQEVEDAIIGKIKAVQLATQKQNEIVQAEADAKKAVAKAEGEAQSILVVAQAQAKANTLLSNSITPVLVNYILAKGWNGVSPQYSGSGSVLPPLFQSNK